MKYYGTCKFVGKKVILRIRDRICETTEELLESDLFTAVLSKYVAHLKRRQSGLLELFGKSASVIGDEDIKLLLRVLQILGKMPLETVPKLLENGKQFAGKPELLLAFVEGLYNYWRTFERFIICDSTLEDFDKRPYRTFDATIEALMHLVRQSYRQIEEHITGLHPHIYRQVHAGAELAVIAMPKDLQLPPGIYSKLQTIPLIRQLLLYPPLLLDPPMNKRSGRFKRVDQNPLELVNPDSGEWLCYPAKVGSLLILVYVHEKFFELGFSLCNLFEPAEDAFLDKKADAVYLFGVPGEALNDLAELPAVFYDDTDNNVLVAACPNDDRFGYFGYLKKMILTLHNIAVMKHGKMPFHGAMVRIQSTKGEERNVLIIGESGTGKSETLEALRSIGDSSIREMRIIADDMGSLELDAEGRLLAYGTEVGAFVRLDDLQPGYAFGQLDRSIIMNPGRVNSRILLPVTGYEEIIKGSPVDLILYANNYEDVDDEHPLIDRLENAEAALHIFREGRAMSKGTTTATGLVHSYFANIFGPVQYRELHEAIAAKFFEAFYARKLFVGQLRTRLGIPGYEQEGPGSAAQALLQKLFAES
ncbi:MAG: phosphoenolpyruvate carboxykinase [Candidatus Neomarinimicrobiota bacterium]|jgi:energy-coupling factor transporter ATP-binding protein EcfA2